MSFRNQIPVDVTSFNCKDCNVPLQKERPKCIPNRVMFLLPALKKVTEKVTEKVSAIRQVVFEKNVAVYHKVLEGKRVRESTRDTYARVLATVSKEKLVTTKSLGSIFETSASQAAAWLERLRVMKLVVREKRPGPARMVWHYFLT